MNTKSCTIHEFKSQGPCYANCYVVQPKDESNLATLIIDPSIRDNTVLDFLEYHGRTIEAIALTHGHLEHLAGLYALYHRFHPKIYLQFDDLWLYENIQEQADHLCVENVEVPDKSNLINIRLMSQFSLSFTQVQIFHTPGHTKGSVCYQLSQDEVCFTGDTLFAGAFGQTNQKTGSIIQLTQSIQFILFSLTDSTIIYPGHLERSSIKTEKQHNPIRQLFIGETNLSKTNVKRELVSASHR